MLVTGLLPRDNIVTTRRVQITQTNKHLKAFCENISFVKYMEQDLDWVTNGKLNSLLYYKDSLHLVEPGNWKLGISILNAIFQSVTMYIAPQSLIL